ncbi:hypothetical protein AB0M46_17300 [Dactylosporangium sp. NPDC051485]|uniref:hypothetical protein n=1 Tax=Dactylosporangium sp. NPDC051485 TaxID=3154846 RepID=UPI0034178E86
MSTAAEYLFFADSMARGSSPLYERLARGVAGDEEILGLLDGQEPPSVFPELAPRLPEAPPSDAVSYALMLDERPLAYAALHGAWLRPFAGRLR